MGGIAALAGEIFGTNDAPQEAAQIQANAANQATDVQLQMFREGQAATAPWREKGEAALNTLVEKVNAGPGDYTKSPGYDFRTSEGQKAIERSAAARGGLISGATGKALTKFGQDYATNDYQNFLANYYNSLTPLQSLAGVGQTTASQNAVLGNQVGTNVGSNIISAGNAQAGGVINNANRIIGQQQAGINNAIAGYSLWKNSQNTSNQTNNSLSEAWNPDSDYQGEWAGYEG
jgi:hypothetical protein